MPPLPQRRRAALAGLGLFVVVCGLAQIWPVYPWVVARAPLLVLGLPFGLVWTLGWVLASLVVLLCAERTLHPRGPRGGR